MLFLMKSVSRLKALNGVKTAIHQQNVGLLGSFSVSREVERTRGDSVSLTVGCGETVTEELWMVDVELESLGLFLQIINPETSHQLLL